LKNLFYHKQQNNKAKVQMKIMRKRRWFISQSLVCLAGTQLWGGWNWPWAKKEKPELVLNENLLRCKYTNRRPEAIIAKITELKAKRGKLTYDEANDLGSAYFSLGQWKNARLAYADAYKLADSDLHKVAVRYLECESLYATKEPKNYAEAGKLSNEACQMLPNCVEIAAARYKYWSLAKDNAQMKLALDHVNSLNVRLEGTAVCDPVTLGIITIAIVGGVATYAIYKGSDPIEVLKTMVPIAMVIYKGAQLKSGDLD